MIEKIDINQPMIEPGLSSGQPKSARAISDKNADVSVQVSYASLIERALREPQSDAERLQQARELLLSGELESSENIREAAENIVKFGM